MVAVGEKEDIADDPEIPNRSHQGGGEGVDNGQQPEGHGGEQADHQKEVDDKRGDGFGQVGHGWMFRLTRKETDKMGAIPNDIC